MVKSHHLFFLQLLDRILETLNTPTKNYTFSYQELFQKVQPDISYDKIYQNQFEKFLTKGYDSYTENTNSTFLINSALRYLVQDGFIFQYNHLPNQYSFQITYKGFLKINNGFKKSFEIEQEEQLNIEKRRKQDLLISVLRLFIPALLAFLLGLFVNKC